MLLIGMQNSICMIRYRSYSMKCLRKALCRGWRWYQLIPNAKKGNKALEFLTLLLHESVAPNIYIHFCQYWDLALGCWALGCFIGVYKYDLESDVVVGGALINVHARWGALGNALAVFNEFMTGDLVVWNSIIGAFAQNSVGDEASFLFKRMKRLDFKLSRQHWQALWEQWLPQHC